MHKFLVTITMSDGSQGRHNGLYPDGFAAVLFAMDGYPEANRISARRLP